jgi:putative methyltransferase (TIGR04325 family)
MIKTFLNITAKILNIISKNIKPENKTNAIWYGNFLNWTDALKNSAGYDSELILRKCKESSLKVKNGEAIYERDSVIFDKIQYSWGLLAGLQKAAIENHGALNVLDFGGSLGSTYYQNKSFLNNLRNIKWNIVEQKHFVECGKEFFESTNLNFYENINDCLKINKPNVLLLSGVLQYLERPDEWIKTFNNLDIKYIIIDRTAFIQGEKDIITIQNVPESIYLASYPAWFFNQEKLVKRFTNFTVVSEIDNSFTDNALIHNKKAKWTGMILKRKA